MVGVLPESAMQGLSTRHTPGEKNIYDNPFSEGRISLCSSCLVALLLLLFLCLLPSEGGEKTEKGLRALVRVCVSLLLFPSISPVLPSRVVHTLLSPLPSLPPSFLSLATTAAA